MSLEWKTLEHHRERNAEWYLAVSVITIAIIATAIILNNALFAIIVGIGFVALLVTYRRGPQQVEVSITSRGVRINNILYTYENLEAFYVDREKHQLMLKSKKFFSAHIIAPLAHDDNLEELEDYLDNYLPEEEMHENVMELFLEYLGF